MEKVENDHIEMINRIDATKKTISIQMMKMERAKMDEKIRLAESTPSTGSEQISPQPIELCDDALWAQKGQSMKCRIQHLDKVGEGLTAKRQKFCTDIERVLVGHKSTISQVGVIVTEVGGESSDGL